MFDKAILIDGLKSVSVEPVLLFNSIGSGIHGVVNRFGIYNAICEQTTAGHCADALNVTMPLNNITGVQQLNPTEVAVQRAAADFQTYFALSYMLPAIFADIILGALGDRYGRKYNILLGLFGFALSVIPAIVLYKNPKTTPLYVLLIGNVFAGLTGFSSIILISSFAYLADTVRDKDMLTIRMAILQVAINVGQMIGPMIAGSISALVELAYQELITLSFMLVAFVLGVVLLRQIPPRLTKVQAAAVVATAAAVGDQQQQERKETIKVNEPIIEIQAIAEKTPPVRGKVLAKDRSKLNLVIPIDSIEETSSVASRRRFSVCGFVAEIAQLLKDVWRTYTKPRPNHARAYLLIMSFVFFATFTAESGLRYGVLGLYVLKAPLRWSQATLGYYDSAHGAAITAGTLIGTVVLKKLFRLSDTSILLIALISATGEMIVVAFSSQTWLLYSSVGVGCLANLVKPCSKSFVAKLVEPDEVGKAYTVFGIAQNIAFMVSTAFYTTLYKATLEFFPGLSFVFAAFVFGAAFVLVLAMYVDSRRMGKVY